MQIICTLLQTDNHASISPLSFYRPDALSCCPINSDKALKANKASTKYNICAYAQQIKATGWQYLHVKTGYCD